MAELAIKVQDLEKTFLLFHDRKSWLRLLFNRNSRLSRFTALRDISLELPKGASLGLVGDNGAGKSTLLRILSGITSPSSGSVNVKGQIGSLLDLGIGFHPDFSGRENIYFSGALAGLTRKEIQEREEEIIDFSELHEFIDEPLKTFSSGMSVRLAFAVATGFDPDILIIDEALSVGDQLFQRKCIERITSHQQQGGTIIFCSHNLNQVKALCESSLWLEHGSAVALGDSSLVIERYRDACRQKMTAESRVGSPGQDSVESRGDVSRLRRISLSGLSIEQTLRSGDSLRLDIWLQVPPDQREDAGVGVALVRSDGIVVFATTTNLDGVALRQEESGLFHIAFCLPDTQLLPGRYAFNIFTSDATSLISYDHSDKVEEFEVTAQTLEQGITRLRHYWE